MLRLLYGNNETGRKSLQEFKITIRMTFVSFKGHSSSKAVIQGSVRVLNYPQIVIQNVLQLLQE